MGKVWAVVGLFFTAHLLGLAQSEEQVRDLWNTALRNQREAGDTPAARKQAVPLVGVTIWRLRKPAPGERDAARLLVHDRDQGEMTAERVSAATPLLENQRIRVSVESATPGFLYVFSQEQYQDGSSGEPYLIFPTLRLHGGDNSVRAGRIVEIPGPEDQPPYFRLEKSRADQVRELLTVLVSPARLTELTIGRQAVPVSRERVAAWQKKWRSRVKALETRTDQGRPYTRVEQEAGAGKMLTGKDPLPQTLYNVEAKPGEPLLVTVPLSIGEPAQKEEL